MVIHNLNIDRTTIRPREANAELIIDPDTMLAFSVTAQLLKAVSRRRPHVLERRGPAQLIQRLILGCCQLTASSDSASIMGEP
jgi:hypothetical protein